MEEADPERNPQQQIIDRMREINEVYRDLAYYDLIIKRRWWSKPADGVELLPEYHQIVSPTA